MTVISVSALSQAKTLCLHRKKSFSEIEARCFSYLDTIEMLTGPLGNEERIDSAFLMLVRSELDNEDDEEASERTERAWLSVNQ